MRRARVAAAGIGLALLLTGCVTTRDYAAPNCTGGEDTLVLMAQSVPDAALVPCIDALPSAWHIVSSEIDSGGSRTVFGSDVLNRRFVVEMNFTAECDLGDAVEVPSDELNVTRYEDVEAVEEGYRGYRYYVFDGGCVAYRFDLGGDGWSAVVNDAAAATTFATRESLSEYVRRNSRGVIEGV